MNIAHVHRLASAFRAAIEKTPQSSLPISMQSFPRGACGDATLLLAKYLEENACGSFDYILGEREDSSHAWLQQGNMVVDITADQFGDMPYAVCVDQLTPWHSTFRSDVQHVADFEIYDERTKAMLRWAYVNIVGTIKRISAGSSNGALSEVRSGT